MKGAKLISTADPLNLVKNKRDFVKDLKDWGINGCLIGNAIRNRTFSPEDVLDDYETLRDQLQRTDPDKLRAIDYAVRNLTALINSGLLTDNEQATLQKIRQRLALKNMSITEKKNAVRSEENRTNIEDYNEDDTGSLPIDPKLNTEQQCEARLIDMMFRYIEKYADTVNNCKLGLQRDYKQKDILELIAEILNIDSPNKYDYESIRTILKNYMNVTA